MCERSYTERNMTINYKKWMKHIQETNGWLTAIQEQEEYINNVYEKEWESNAVKLDKVRMDMKKARVYQ